MQEYLKNISATFKYFAENECKNKSKLYHDLALQVATDKYLLELTLISRKRQPIPNLLFGAVHYLLLSGQGKELSNHYPSISKRDSQTIPFELFKQFCQEKEEALIEILKTRIVQTNSINRTSYLMPIISSLFEKDRALTLVDIGTSSGLTLNYDHYEYHYGDSIINQSEVKVTCEVRSGKLPRFTGLKRAHRKIGIDQNPLDLSIADNAMWLKALIWPDMITPFTTMDAAIVLYNQVNEVELYKADQVETFEKILSSVPTEEDLFVYHTHALYQFSREERALFRTMLDRIGQQRNFTYLAVEAGMVFDQKNYNPHDVLIELTKYGKGKKDVLLLGQADGHGSYVKWA
jgi:hypothetical protein